MIRNQKEAEERLDELAKRIEEWNRGLERRIAEFDIRVAAVVRRFEQLKRFQRQQLSIAMLALSILVVVFAWQ